MKNRPIKFRAWDRKRKLFVLLDNIWDMFFEGQETENNGSCAFTNREHGLFDKEDYEFTQFTGVINSKDQEIYEGDIVQTNGQVCQVVYDDQNASFMVKDFDWGHTFGGVKLTGAWLNQVVDGPNGSSFEVIGNIYENPELLKEHENN